MDVSLKMSLTWPFKSRSQSTMRYFFKSGATTSKYSEKEIGLLSGPKSCDKPK